MEEMSTELIVSSPVQLINFDRAREALAPAAPVVDILQGHAEQPCPGLHTVEYGFSLSLVILHLANAFWYRYTGPAGARLCRTDCPLATGSRERAPGGGSGRIKRDFCA